MPKKMGGWQSGMRSCSLPKHLVQELDVCTVGQSKEVLTVLFAHCIPWSPEMKPTKAGFPCPEVASMTTLIGSLVQPFLPSPPLDTTSPEYPALLQNA